MSTFATVLSSYKHVEEGLAALIEKIPTSDELDVKAAASSWKAIKDLGVQVKKNNSKSECVDIICSDETEFLAKTTRKQILYYVCFICI